MLDGFEQPAWITATLERICDSGVARIELVVLNDRPPSTARRKTTQRIANWWRVRHALPYEAYRRIDRRRYVRAGDPEFLQDATDLFTHCPLIRVSPRLTQYCDYFDDDAVAEIRRHDLDLVVRFGFRILRGEALQIAKYGVWSFHHGDNYTNRGGQAGFWEVMREEPATGAVLQVLSEELDGGLVLGRCYSSTNPISVTSNKHNLYWQAAPLLEKTLRDLQVQGSTLFDEARTESDWTAYSRSLYKQPGGLTMIALMARVATRLVRRKFHDFLRRDQWFIAYRLSKAGSARDNVPDGSPFRFKELIPPGDRFWADPIPVAVNDKHYIFFEEFIFGSPRAHICVTEIDHTGAATNTRRVLELPFHLSYPFVFAWQNEWYMIPETLEKRAVDLYRATHFPDCWQFDRTLLNDIPAMDSTVAEIDGRWWMFTEVTVPGVEEGTHLDLYHAPSPLGPWKAHQSNPVKIDVRNSRPAGPLFQYNGHWYRPAQCGAPNYGSAIVMNRIVELSPARFCEVEVSRLTPSWRPGLNGTHTIAAAGGLTVIDVRQARRRF